MATPLRIFVTHAQLQEIKRLCSFWNSSGSCLPELDKFFHEQDIRVSLSGNPQDPTSYCPFPDGIDHYLGTKRTFTIVPKSCKLPYNRAKANTVKFIGRPDGLTI